MKVFILCGGFGTRLRSIIGDAQKAVADVEGKPFLLHVINELIGAGLCDLVFCVHFQSQQVEDALATLTKRPGLVIRIVRESSPLGTAGAVINAIREIAYEGSLLVINADTFIVAMGYAAARDAVEPAMLVTAVSNCTRFGAIRVDGSQRVLGLVEKGVVGPGLISAGVYKLHTDDLAEFSAGVLSMERDVIPRLIADSRLTATSYEGPFVDIGTPESLQLTRLNGVQGI